MVIARILALAAGASWVWLRSTEQGKEWAALSRQLNEEMERARRNGAVG